MGTEKEELMQQALALNAEDRVALAVRLLESVHEGPDVRHIITAAKTVCGIDEMDYKSREQKYVEARCLTAFALAQMGMPAGEIGAVLHKDRATAIYCRKKMQDAFRYPGSFPGLINKYARFNELLYGTSDKRTN